MKISAALLASAANANPAGQAASSSSSSERGVRGFMGPSTNFEENPIPIKDCESNKDCWSSKIAKKKGWEDSDVKNLMCDKDSGECICKVNFMDANDDLKKDGCEQQINEEDCPYGSCEDMNVAPGDQCGAWRFLTCSQETSCCECTDDNCGADMELDADATCEEQCEAKCNEMTDATQPCIEKCNMACDAAAGDDKPDDEEEDKPDEDDKCDPKDEDCDKPDDDKCNPDEEDCDKPDEDGEKPDDMGCDCKCMKPDGDKDDMKDRRAADSEWPVEGCEKNSACFAKNIKKFDGWKQSDAANLMCDVDSGFCVCKDGFFNADEDAMNGCESDKPTDGEEEDGDNDGEVDGEEEDEKV